jgi:hypothetical protein
MIRVVMQYTQTGWGGLLPNLARTRAEAAKEGVSPGAGKSGGRVIDATATQTRTAAGSGVSERLKGISSRLRRRGGGGDSQESGS